jgi:hypothetical protein
VGLAAIVVVIAVAPGEPIGFRIADLAHKSFLRKSKWLLNLFIQEI